MQRRSPDPAPLPQAGEGGSFDAPQLHAGAQSLARERERERPARRDGEGRPPPHRPAVRRLLILGGTTEAAELARRAVVAFAGQLDVITSLAGRLPNHPDLPGRLRVGGFGGAAGLSRYLQAERIDLLVDATHPFAAAISHNAAEACAALGVPRLTLVRPPWRPGQGDCWLEVDSLEQAAASLAAIGRRVFLTTGQGGIEAFSENSGCWFLVRLFTPPDRPLPLPDHETIVARPSFTREGERELMRRHRIDAMVTKNSGRADQGEAQSGARPRRPNRDGAPTAAAGVASGANRRQRARCPCLGRPPSLRDCTAGVSGADAARDGDRRRRGGSRGTRYSPTPARPGSAPSG